MRLPLWMNPLFLMSIWIMVALYSLLAEPFEYTLMLNSQKHFNLKYFWLSIISISVFSLSCAIGMIKYRRSAPQRQSHIEEQLREGLINSKFRTVTLFFFIMTVCAYGIWFVPTLNAELLKRFLSGDGIVNARGVVSTIGGVTTMTQFGVAISAICGIAIAVVPKGKHRRFYFRVFITLTILSLFRSIVWSERLAFVEIVLPFGLAYVSMIYRGQLAIKILPFVGLILMLLFFGVAEYFRSWNFYKQFDIPFVEFVVSRFMSYYLSSFNNMAMIMEHGVPSGMPIITFEFLFKMPMPGFQKLNEIHSEQWGSYVNLLETWANPEFNLFTIMGFLYSDFGKLGSLLIMVILGLMTGNIYKLLKLGDLKGLVIYPIWMIGILEFGRMYYWGLSRTLPFWVLCIILILLWKKLMKSGGHSVSTVKNTFKVGEQND